MCRMYETKKYSTLHLMECLMCTLEQCGKMRFIVPSVGHIVPSCRVMATPDSRCRLVSFGTLNKSWYYALCCEQWQMTEYDLPSSYTDCTVMYKLILNASEYYYCYILILSYCHTHNQNWAGILDLWDLRWLWIVELDNQTWTPILSLIILKRVVIITTP